MVKSTIDFSVTEQIGNITLHNCDCLSLLRSLPNGSVDLMFTDPPYAVTKNKWDTPINLKELWPEWERVVKDNGAMIFTSQQPFTTDLINSNRKLFRYDLIWEKSIATGFLNANKMPLRTHETVLIFYKKLPVYNPIKPVIYGRSSFKKARKNRIKNNNYGEFANQNSGSKDGSRFPLSIFSVQYENSFFDSSFNTAQQMIHPTQKPVSLPKYFIKTFSNPGDTVFDGYLGSASTAIASYEEGRKFIGSELSPEYFEASVKRLRNHVSQTVLF